MIILGIETSCDDTAVAVVEGEGIKYPRFSILANIVSSQVEIHKKYGGVYPAMAKREHQKNLVPVLLSAIKLSNVKFQNPNVKSISRSKIQKIEKILEREHELFEPMEKEIFTLKKPKIDAIAVTEGPGLEPTLWVGINFARALSILWDTPIIGVDHMEGHIFANFLTEIGADTRNENKAETVPAKLGQSQLCGANAISFPALALAVSGGHTQLILIKRWMEYELLGETLDDAAGEAFDKIARLLGLGFPGGPEIQKIAQKGNVKAFAFPRPLLNSKDYNFSFSGLKTAILYTVQKMSEKEIETKKADLAASFQQAVIDVLITKTINAARAYNVKTIMLGGGVAANKELQNQMGQKIAQELPTTEYKIPNTGLSTDNAAMIAAAGYAHIARGEISNLEKMNANSNKVISEPFR